MSRALLIAHSLARSHHSLPRLAWLDSCADNHSDARELVKHHRCARTTIRAPAPPSRLLPNLSTAVPQLHRHVEYIIIIIVVIIVIF